MRFVVNWMDCDGIYARTFLSESDARDFRKLHLKSSDICRVRTDVVPDITRKIVLGPSSRMRV